MADKTLYLLDGMALVYRGHFALIRSPRMTSKGLNTSSLFVFANTLLDILGNTQPSHLAVVFDTPEPTFRDEIYKEYKAQREKMPEDISGALPYIDQMCEAFNVPVIRKPGYEADDVIGTLAKEAEKFGFTTYMVTPDKDYAQLVSNKTFISKPGRTGDGAEILGVPEILEQWEIERVDQVIDMLGLMGDSSDNVPGVPGIGPKTAQKLIAQYDSVEGLLDHVDELKGKQKENVETYREQALLSKELVTIHLNVPLDFGLDDLAVKTRDEQKLKTLFAELEFSTLGKRLFGNDFNIDQQQISLFGDETAVAGVSTHKTIADVEHTYHLVDTPEKRAALIEKLAQQKAFCFDTETTGLNPRTCEMLGIAFSFQPHTGYYVPMPEDPDKNKTVLEEFRGILENPNTEKIGHNLKFDLAVLLWQGIRVQGLAFDTMLAAYVTAPEMRRGMDSLSLALLGYEPIKIESLIGEKEKGKEQKTLREVPLDKVAEYAAEDADITLQLSEALRPKIKEMGQTRVFEDIECPLVSVLAQMEYEGIRMEASVIEALSEDLQDELVAIRQRIYDLAGETFNLNSPKQLGDILFEKLKLDPNARRTAKTKQYQTGESILQRLAYKHEIVEQILEYRTYSKLKSTYLDMLPGAVFKGTGHIHTHYEQAVTATGRLQSHGPNLQNIPIRTEKGREIRKAFVPRNENYTLLSADYSQIELRVAAELSRDEEMHRAFREGLDIHAATAMKIYGLDERDVTDDMRRQAKTVNFGIIYGISAFGLAQRLNIPRFEAGNLIEQYFEQFPGAKKYMDDTIDFAREHGYVETMTGRRRYLRDIHSRNATTRKSAERNAINSRIQGTAADMIKIAMRRVQDALFERDLKTRMLLQVHDELVFDMHKDEADIAMPLIEDAMKNALPMSVPIVVEMGMGNTWLEAH
ncbi:MAG: DNA polymerase I [Gemmatimonadetes bacterium]|nr:DNA polymerase I [Gemmatimonadota bacterium]MYF75377.1 DNA polymerase I [Gemmatimonadota bacterium]MYK50233.1 DNA polymerase I [Gemmatimonadota bacterium]